MRPNRWLLAMGSVLLAVSCSPEGGGEDGDAGESVFSKDRKRRILYYDAASQETWGYLDQGRKIPYMKLIADIKDHQDFLDTRTNMTFGTQVDTYVFHVGKRRGPSLQRPGGDALALFQFLRGGAGPGHRGLPRPQNGGVGLPEE